MSPPPETLAESPETRGEPQALHPEAESLVGDGAQESLGPPPDGSAEVAGKAVAAWDATVGGV
eukprot:15540668-Heterocapsa_arctica.AAC.1